MQPVAEFEQSGFVSQVVFPTGLIDCGATVSVYYGAADTCIGSAEFSRAELLMSLAPHAAAAAKDQ